MSQAVPIQKPTLKEMREEALRKCAETCSKSWDHTPDCLTRFKLLMDLKVLQEKARAS